VTCPGGDFQTCVYMSCLSTEDTNNVPGISHKSVPASDLSIQANKKSMQERSEAGNFRGEKVQKKVSNPKSLEPKNVSNRSLLKCEHMSLSAAAAAVSSTASHVRSDQSTTAVSLRVLEPAVLLDVAAPLLLLGTCALRLAGAGELVVHERRRRLQRRVLQRRGGLLELACALEEGRCGGEGFGAFGR